MKKHISKLKVVSGIFLLVIITMALLLFRNYKTEQEKQAKAEEQLKAQIAQDRVEDALKRKILSFLDECKEEAEYDEKTYDYWLRELSLGEYNGIQINMWDPDSRCEEWYSQFFAKTIKSIGYNVNKPEKITGFLRAAMGSGNKVEKVVIYIEPYLLYKNYEKRFVFDDSEKLTFPQELRAFLLSVIAEYPDVEFRVNLPVIEADEWISYDAKTREAKLDIWRECIQYCSWYQNVTIHSMGTEKWLAINPDSFEDGRMKPDVSQTVFAYENTPSYVIDDESVAAVFEDFSAMLGRYAGFGFDSKKFDDYRIAFFGDSVIRKTDVDSISIPGLLSSLSGASCYNLAINGSAASIESAGSFVNVTNALKNGKPVEGADDLNRTATEKFLSEKQSGKKTVFITEYGFNDYVSGSSATVFADGLKKGIENLKEAYPDAVFVVLSPIYTDYGNAGKDAYVKGGSPLKDYIKAEEKLASDAENVYFVNLFDNGPIKADNTAAYLLDGVHPTYSGNLAIAEELVSRLSEILVKR
jgi:lysophospholipase L1-like esterase